MINTDVFRSRWAAFLAVLLVTLCSAAHAQPAGQSAQHLAASSADTAIPAAALLQPAQLAAMLRHPVGEKPLILQVGSHVLYAEAHIPGAEYAGAAGDGAGLETLRNRVQGLKRNSFVVIYCGCCPWNKCPNIRPAYRELRTLGFTHVKALYIADNFGTDWVSKGYPVAKGR